MADCTICAEDVAEDARDRLQCKSCEAVYHRECRIAKGHCVTGGCPRSAPIEDRDRERNASILQADVVGFFEGRMGARLFWFVVACAVGLGVLLGQLIFGWLPD